MIEKGAGQAPSGSSRRCRQAGQRSLVIPRHPLPRILGQFGGMLLQLGQVVERIPARQFRGVDQAHEQVGYLGATLGFEEERVLSIENSFLEGSFTNRVIRVLPAGVRQDKNLPEKSARMTA